MADDDPAGESPDEPESGGEEATVGPGQPGPEPGNPGAPAEKPAEGWATTDGHPPLRTGRRWVPL